MNLSITKRESFPFILYLEVLKTISRAVIVRERYPRSKNEAFRLGTTVIKIGETREMRVAS